MTVEQLMQILSTLSPDAEIVIEHPYLYESMEIESITDADGQYIINIAQ